MAIEFATSRSLSLPDLRKRWLDCSNTRAEVFIVAASQHKEHGFAAWKCSQGSFLEYGIGGLHRWESMPVRLDFWCRSEKRLWDRVQKWYLAIFGVPELFRNRVDSKPPRLLVYFDSYPWPHEHFEQEFDRREALKFEQKIQELTTFQPTGD